MQDTNQQPSSERSSYSIASVLRASAPHLKRQAIGSVAERQRYRQAGSCLEAEVLTTMDNNITNDVLVSHLLEVL